MKRFDLNPDPAMSPVIGLLHATSTYNYQRLRRLLIGLSQEEVDYRGPNNDQNSIAQLMRHLKVVDMHWIFRLQFREITDELRATYGPLYDEQGKLPLLEGIPLQTLWEEYDHFQVMFKEVCMNLTDDDLLRDVIFENGNQATVRFGIWHIADHSRHHYATMVHMRKLWAYQVQS